MAASRGAAFEKRIADAAEDLWSQIPVGDREDPVKALSGAQIAMAWFRVPYGRDSRIPARAYAVVERRIAAMRAKEA